MIQSTYASELSAETEVYSRVCGRTDYHYETIEPQTGGKRSADAASHSTGSNGENRHWAIPYRFGKRGAMPYRFGKRAAMPYRFGKRAGMHFRLGKKSAAL